MNDIALVANNVQTMSSREIAELCEKRHDHVMVDIRKMLSDLSLHAPDFSGTYQTDRGNEYECFHLPKRETLILVSGYKLDLRARIIDRWQQLEDEARQRPAMDPMTVLNDPAAMRGLLLGYSEKVLALEARTAELEPKAQALTRIADTEDSFTPTDAAKTLGVRPTTLINWLRGPGKWMYRRPGGDHDVAYQDKLQKGWMTHRVHTIRRSDGSDRTIMQPRITAKGLAELAQTFNAKDERRTYMSNRLKALRREAGLTQKQLAERMDILTTPSTVAKLETGQMAFSLDYVQSIAKVLGVPASALIDLPEGGAPGGSTSM